jgi:hypothetical protein
MLYPIPRLPIHALLAESLARCLGDPIDQRFQEAMAAHFRRQSEVIRDVESRSPGYFAAMENGRRAALPMPWDTEGIRLYLDGKHPCQL